MYSMQVCERQIALHQKLYLLGPRQMPEYVISGTVEYVL